MRDREIEAGLFVRMGRAIGHALARSDMALDAGNCDASNWWKKRAAAIHQMFLEARDKFDDANEGWIET